ncbi:MAG: hypothetical protein MZW92_33145 [Comamonadaceae bacterium]|nr:hypothetical protein [Comamonadaceae bacterium]
MADASRLRDHDASFVAARRVVFGIVLASFVLSFFHRTAPAAIAGELTPRVRDQRRGARHAGGDLLLRLHACCRSRSACSPTRWDRAASWRSARAIAAAGSLLFALAPAWELAAVGRTLVGIGVSVAFIAILKISALWFPPNRFATLPGVTMFAGNLGAVVAGAPLAWVVTQASWRCGVRRARGAVGRCSALATWLRVRDRPEDRGFAPVSRRRQRAARASTGSRRSARVLANPRDLAGASSSTSASAAATSPSPACGRCRGSSTPTRMSTRRRRPARERCCCSAWHSARWRSA